MTDPFHQNSRKCDINGNIGNGLNFIRYENGVTVYIKREMLRTNQIDPFLSRPLPLSVNALCGSLTPV